MASGKKKSETDAKSKRTDEGQKRRRIVLNVKKRAKPSEPSPSSDIEKDEPLKTEAPYEKTREANEGERDTKELAIDGLIKNHVIVAMGIGIVPIPFVDIAAITLVQVRLIRRVARCYGITTEENAIRTTLTALTSGVGAVAGSTTLVAGFNKLSPGIGWVIGASTMSTIAGATTYAVGKVYASHFATGGNLDDFNPTAMRENFRRLFDGKLNG